MYSEKESGNRFSSLDRQESAFDVEDFFIYEQAKFRGLAIFLFWSLCLVLFAGGLHFPLVEVVILPGDSGLQKVLVKSVMDMIWLAFQTGQLIVGFVLLLCTVLIPLVILCVGMPVVMYENFLATGLGWNHLLSYPRRVLLVSVMYISTSYQVVMIFLIMLFSVFFTGFGSETAFRAGFYFLALYCLASILLVQGMELFRLDGNELSKERDEEVQDAYEATRVGSVTGFHLRRQLSSFFPSLPGIKENLSVDTFQVFFFMLAIMVLLKLGFDQPLMDVRVMYDGISLQRKVLSLRDVMMSLMSGLTGNLLVMLMFLFLVVVFPVVYGCFMVLAGVIDLAKRFHFVEEDEERLENFEQYVLYSAKILRPWVMMDVFTIALMIVLTLLQTEYVSASIPDGTMGVGPQRGSFHQYFSGMYFMVGAGMATIFLRWYWSTSAGEDKNGVRLYRKVDPNQENFITVYIVGKSCRWIMLCFVLIALLHSRSVPGRTYELASMNEVLQNAVPVINKYVVEKAPQTMGNCKYPALGSPMAPPQPCYQMQKGHLDKELKKKFRITAEWMSGLKTMTFTNISIARTISPDFAPVLSPNFTKKERFTLDVSGVFGEPKLFLKIEECPVNHTTLQTITGSGLCKPFLDTDDSCCAPNRRWGARLIAECHDGEGVLTNFQVQDMWLDTMTVRPEMSQKAEMFHGNIKVVIADKNISKMVLETVKTNMLWYLTDEPLMRVGGENLNVVGFVNRVLRFNSRHQEFRCR